MRCFGQYLTDLQPHFGVIYVVYFLAVNFLHLVLPLIGCMICMLGSWCRSSMTKIQTCNCLELYYDLPDDPSATPNILQYPERFISCSESTLPSNLFNLPEHTPICPEDQLTFSSMCICSGKMDNCNWLILTSHCKLLVLCSQMSV